MAEILGAVASVTQLMHLSGTLLVGGYGFLATVARAPAEIRNLLTETAAINSLLGHIQLIAESDSNSKVSQDDALQALERLGTFDECHVTLQFLQQAIAKCQEEAGKDFRNLGKRLKWPFKERETKEAFERLNRLRGVLASAVEVDSAKSLRRIETAQSLMTDEVQTLTNQFQARASFDEKQTVMSWLCPQTTAGLHTSLEIALSRRLPGTGTWFLDSKTFEWWCTAKHSSLWITGLPGSGKTLLCASSIQRIRTEKKERTAVLFFFCDHRDPVKRTYENFIISLVRQMIEMSSELMGQAKKIYNEKASGGDRAFNHVEYMPLIESFMGQFEEIFLFCDALDEASDGSEIADALQKVLEYGVKRHVPTRILLTSRFDVQFERRHTQITSNRLALAENMKPDIKQYIGAEVNLRVANSILKMRDKALGVLIQEHITFRAGTMLQARLQLDYLTTARNDRDLKDMISTLPDGLEHTYEMLLHHSASRYPERIGEMKILLQCLAIGSPTLTATNLAEILVLRPGRWSIDFDSVATDPYDNLDIIAPLLTITRTKQSDSVVKLSHFSLDEYLLSDRILQGHARQFHVDRAEGNAWMACICLQYLTLDVFHHSSRDQSPSYLLALENYTFRRYAALNWFRHYKAAGDHTDVAKCCEPYMRRLFDANTRPPCYRRWQEVYGRTYLMDEIHLYSPICFAISQGLDEIVNDLLPQLDNVNYSFRDSYTCLTTAAKWNRSSTVRKLLELGADLEIPSEKQCTPLHLAAEYACFEAAEVLLEAGANPHAKSSSGSTPFYRACRGGDIRIVQRLKECGSDINNRTYDSWTPTMEAVENGHEHILDLLLEWGADLTIRTIQGWTALLIAVDGVNLTQNRSLIETLEKATPEFAQHIFTDDDEEEEARKKLFGLVPSPETKTDERANEATQQEHPRDLLEEGS